MQGEASSIRHRPLGRVHQLEAGTGRSGLRHVNDRRNGATDDRPRRAELQRNIADRRLRCVETARQRGAFEASATAVDIPMLGYVGLLALVGFLLAAVMAALRG